MPQRVEPRSWPGTVLDGWPALVVDCSRAVPAYGRALRGGGATRRAAFAAWVLSYQNGLRLLFIAHGLFRPLAGPSAGAAQRAGPHSRPGIV
ncbi:MAG: hypothetical protein AAF732_23580, partial [Pseudomonadota bacterium]